MFKIKLVRFILFSQNSILNIFKKLFWYKRESNYSNICIYRISNIGDTICSIPAMLKIKQQYPKAKITLLTCPGNKGALGAKEILTNEPWLDEILVYYTDDLKGIKNIISFIKKMRLKQFDYFLQLPTEKTGFILQLRNLFFAKTLGIKCADGFYVSTINIFPREQFNYCIFLNEVERLVNNLPFSSSYPTSFNISISEDDKNIVKNCLNKDDIKLTDKIMAISFSGKGTAKKWTVHNFNEIARRWIENGGKVIVIGSINDSEEGELIINNLPKDNCFNYCGLFSIKESMYLLKRITFLLTIDTGTAHMAAAVGTRSVTIFSSCYYPYKWFAYGNNNTIITHAMECSPCLKKECKYGEALCMESISANKVWNHIEKIILNKL